MKKIILLTVLGLSVSILSGCVSREQADEKLTMACRAAVEALLYENQKIDDVKSATHMASPVGTGFRHVTIVAVTEDGWLESESQYDCIFEESFGLMKKNYTASVYQIQMEDRTIGKAGSEILGSTEEFVKIENAVRAALYQ